MGRTETGKERIEQFIMDIAQRMAQTGAVCSFVWWSPAGLEPAAEKPSTLPNVPLRIYRGNSWRAIEFLRSDIDECGAAPEVLKKYEEEISGILAEL